jgi:hypothetical protein
MGVPFLWQQSSTSSLKSLQGSQTANATDQSNLKLEQVNYSTRADLIQNLPLRIRDVLVRPYPWQIGNTSQQLGVLGTLFGFAVLVLLLQALGRSWGSVMDRAGPFVYLGGFLLIAYALSVGNAGTGFRYRTHLLAIGICLLMVLRERQRVAVTEAPPESTAPSVPALAR